ncbi:MULTISPECIES: hypothetical protein [unclassified Streptomyces]|uniref:hypothetical protein n=1 Tax=unclassified Streptomyces TaxID=2593676 RepID=UPI002DD9B8F1|nr:hypothetical protein [Streptomyces sp. NBC_01750]WSB01602.1 hypothetical protein OIE54_21235 [Streptomyces sp. NBC_01794]WSD34070.1 hypothetical protein OG966_20540 [Streptomyces sp. NBC_01750]
MLLKLTRTGIVIHWYAEQGPKWLGRAALNGLVALLTGVSAFVVTATPSRDRAQSEALERDWALSTACRPPRPTWSGSRRALPDGIGAYLITRPGRGDRLDA